MISEPIEPNRWIDLDKLLLNDSPFADKSSFVPGQEIRDMFLNYSRILIVGAGGLGCEILKDLALSGFREIHIIDLDKIDISNLNRQFLFRLKDVGRYKSEVAAEFINKRVKRCKVVAHIGKIQDMSLDFYEQFNVFVAGLDNIEARQYLNLVVHTLVDFDDNQNPKPETVRALIDGGTEGFRGQARVIWPYKTACFECTMDSLTPQTKYNLCTITNTPRKPEHCISYSYLILWGEKFPGRKVDTDSKEDMTWIFEQARERALQYGIPGVDYNLTIGVVKNIIPAIASTNALIAAACSNEALKIMTGCSKSVENYFMFMGQTGIYTSTFAYDKKMDCIICSDKNLKKKFEEK